MLSAEVLTRLSGLSWSPVRQIYTLAISARYDEFSTLTYAHHVNFLDFRHVPSTGGRSLLIF